MDNYEILEYLKDNYVNMLFKEDDNKNDFLCFLYEQGVIGFNRTIDGLMDQRHISFYYSDFTLCDYCLSGNIELDGFEECYYEDLLNTYKVELI